MGALFSKGGGQQFSEWKQRGHDMSLHDRLSRLEKMTKHQSKLKSRLFWAEYANTLVECEMQTFSPTKAEAEAEFLRLVGCVSISEFIDKQVARFSQ